MQRIIHDFDQFLQIKFSRNTDLCQRNKIYLNPLSWMHFKKQAKRWQTTDGPSVLCYFLLLQLTISTVRFSHWRGMNLSNRNSTGTNLTTVLLLLFSPLYTLYVCCLPVVLSTGWELKKDFYGLSVSGRQVLVFMPFVVLSQKHKLDFIVQQNWPVPQEMW